MQTTGMIGARALLHGNLLARRAPFDPNAQRPILWDNTFCL
jgi:hypothetical protein